MIEDTIQAVKAAEEKAKETVAGAREKAKDIARSTDAEVQELFTAARTSDKSFYDNEMQLAEEKGKDILEKAAEEMKAMTEAARSKTDEAVKAVTAAVLAGGR